MDNKLDIKVVIQADPFSMAYGYDDALAGRSDIGAVVSFTGLVRDFNETPDVTGLTLEHYPGMTERTLTEIGEQAWQRWSLQAVRIIHRVGYLGPGDPLCACWWLARIGVKRLKPAILLWIF